MDKTLSIKIDKAGQTIKAVLSGDITEDSDFTSLASADASQLILDLSDIRRINSTGVREWIKFVNSISKAGRELVLEKCSVAIVQQLNMISNFRGNGQVRSILAPYYCESCDENRVHLIDLTNGTPTIEPNIDCPKCKSPMEFDEI